MSDGQFRFRLVHHALEIMNRGVGRLRAAGPAFVVLSHWTASQAAIMGTRPTTMPTQSERPMSILRLSTMKSGPGCGTVSEWVTTPPAQMAQHIKREVPAGAQGHGHGDREHEHEHRVKEDRNAQDVGADDDGERDALGALAADGEKPAHHLVRRAAFHQRHADDRGHADDDGDVSRRLAEPDRGQLEGLRQLATRDGGDRFP